MYVYTHTRTCMCLHTHTNTHTHSPVGSLPTSPRPCSPICVPPPSRLIDGLLIRHWFPKPDWFDWSDHQGQKSRGRQSQHLAPSRIMFYKYFQPEERSHNKESNCSLRTSLWHQFDFLSWFLSILLQFDHIWSLIVSSSISIEWNVPAVQQTKMEVQTENGQLPKLETGIFWEVKLSKKLGVAMVWPCSHWEGVCVAWTLSTYRTIYFMKADVTHHPLTHPLT